MRVEKEILRKRHLPNDFAATSDKKFLRSNTGYEAAMRTCFFGKINAQVEGQTTANELQLP